MLSHSFKRDVLEKIFHLWPKIIAPDLRRTCRDNIRKISVQERKEEMASGLLSNRVDPWAFIRVKDERPTLLASLNSLLPVISKGVIAYNDCSDGSDEIIEQFCLDNPGFIPFHYPHWVEPAGSKKYAEQTLAYENTLAGYYNAVLDLIPKNEWIIKVDADLFYVPQVLEHSFHLPRSQKDYVSYSRLNVIREGSEIRVINHVRPGDCWLIYNDNLKFKNEYGYFDGEDGKRQFYSYERLIFPRKNVPYTPECSSIHFPCEKKYRPFTGDASKLIGLEDYLKQADPSVFSDDLLWIKEVIKDFDLSESYPRFE